MKRIATVCASTGLVLTTLAVSAPSADAWRTAQESHGGKVQLCKAPSVGGGYLVWIRLDNRLAKHIHRAGLSRYSDGASVNVAAAGGAVSSSRALLWRSGLLSSGISELNGQGKGSAIAITQIPGC